MSSAMELMHPSIAAAAAAAGRLPQPALLAALSELFLLATHAQVRELHQCVSPAQQ